MGLMIHTAGHLKILRMALETLRSRAVEEVDEAFYGFNFIIKYSTF